MKRLVQPLGSWPKDRGTHAGACARYRAKNTEKCRAAVRASKLKAKNRNAA